MRKLTIYRLYFTKSDCYKRGIKQTPRGVQVHSTGANNPYLKRYVQPDDGQLGVNTNGNSHNRPGGNVCASAYIGKLADGTVAVYQALPWDYRCWLSGSGKNGNANNLGYIGFEICEDNTENEQYFNEAVKDKAVLLTAYLCQIMGKTPWEVIEETPSGPAYAVMDHSELHRIGLASNHGDIGKWLSHFGYNFKDFRYWVQEALEEGIEANYIDAKEEKPMDHPTLRKGATGGAVYYLQTMLNDVIPGITIDGRFGEQTEKAVRVFQAAEKIKVDGVVGPVTWDALENATDHRFDGYIPPAEGTPPTNEPEQPDESTPEPPAEDDPEQPTEETTEEDAPVVISRKDWNTLREIVQKYTSVG